MKVLVCGSRTWERATQMYVRLAKLPPNTTIIHGDARGADRMAAALAESLGLRVVAFPADWDRHGKKAGFIRNIEMLEQGPELVLAFQVGNSKGTQHTINQARKRGIPVEVTKA